MSRIACNPMAKVRHSHVKCKKYGRPIFIIKNNWNNLDNYLIDGQLLELFQLSLLFSCDVVV